MCGIVGLVAPEANRHREVVSGMVDSIGHRGPDDRGIAAFQSCILGHVRLSIVDPTGGSQPMFGRERHTCITFNGEIYGYLDLKRRLPGYPFRTSSDTELLLALYERDGVGMLGDLPGMFSFALWDDERRALFAARDRFGEKPFYYAWGRNGEFIFGSEIKAILSTGLVEPMLDQRSLIGYLKNVYVPADRTIYGNIFTLPPAHGLLLDSSGLKIWRYWNFPETRDPIDLGEARAEFRRLFRASVAKQLVADVPVGAFLSGGLDSSTVVAEAARLKPGLNTFSFGFEDAENEHQYAKEIAEKYGTTHHELTARDIDLAQLLLKMNDVFDEPFGDSSNIPTYLLSRLARRHLKVILTGDGGDELLGGYPFWYRPLALYSEGRRYSPFEDFAIRSIARLTNGLHSPSTLHWQSLRTRSRLRREHRSVIDVHSARPVQFSESELHNMLLFPYSGYSPQTEFDWKLENNPNDGMKSDMSTYMPGDILVKVDRSSMAHGLELRAPFLDRDFAEFCISLPWQLKVTSERDKIILRETYESDWTDRIRRRGKAGFGAPVNKWLMRPTLREIKKDYLDDPSKKLFSLFSFQRTRKVIEEDSQRTWQLLVLGIWLEKGPDSLLGFERLRSQASVVVPNQAK